MLLNPMRRILPQDGELVSGRGSTIHSLDQLLTNRFRHWHIDSLRQPINPLGTSQRGDRRARRTGQSSTSEQLPDRQCRVRLGKLTHGDPTIGVGSPPIPKSVSHRSNHQQSEHGDDVPNRRWRPPWNGLGHDNIVQEIEAGGIGSIHDRRLQLNGSPMTKKLSNLIADWIRSGDRQYGDF